MIIDVGNMTIDFDKVERVGCVCGDPNWLSYKVHFTGGGIVEIYENRQHSEGWALPQMKRAVFIEHWKKSKEPK